jgi:hypothetical protein
VGITIGLGLLFDTLIVRSFMMPSIAAMLGRWFWWPTNVWHIDPPRAARVDSDAGHFDDDATAQIAVPAASNGTAHGHRRGHGNGHSNGATNGSNGALNGNGSARAYHR